MHHKLIPNTFHISKRWKNLWQTKEIHALMLLSLLIQIILTFFAPRRKTVSKATLSLLMWLLYLSADAVALYAIGLISKNSFPGDSSSTNLGCHVAQNARLLAFWAPFLLLHLGGPDTITALALQDNELWHRHALQLTTQVVLSVYVFFRAFACKVDVYVLIPTVLMFVDGCVKYIERTCALYSASVENIRDAITRKPEEAAPNYSRLMEEYSSARNAGIPVSLDDMSAKAETYLDENNFRANFDRSSEVWCEVEETDEMIRDAHNCYVKVQGLLADAYLSLKDREEIRTFFLKKQASEAIKIVEIELNLIYDILYTKAFLLQRKRAFVRVLCFFAVVASLVLFSLSYKRGNGYEGLDVMVTFALLGGAIALDLCAFIMLVFSDWWVILMSSDDTPRIMKSMMECLHYLSKRVKRTSRDRWSQSISKYNLLTRCFRETPLFLKYVFIERIKDLLTGLIYVESGPINKSQVMKFIVEELQTKSELAFDLEEAKEVSSARGNLVYQNDYFLASECLRQWTIDLDFDASVLTWHLATDICYWTSDQSDHRPDECSNKLDYRFISKELSDYMSYLLLRQQTLTFPVMGMSHFRFKDTCSEAKKYSKHSLDPWCTYISAKIRKMIYELILKRKPKSVDENEVSKDEIVLKDFCENVKKEADFRRSIGIAKGDIANSVLFEAYYLAQRLKMFGDKQWEITGKVWVELLSYAATRCSPRSHLAQLSKGGELITIVWLLMSHLGLGDRFMQTQGFRWTKLIIPK
ncbi:hypothetical protein RND81_10G103000 [Saponaria officinalis]|uniref:DUF4220 domain-containing protein n=1 Tax=Saponaria officinalis TaxID=3572 RepID=A0AAW1I0P6_SAPOF